MKRWLLVISRVGTVMVAVGLALLLVSLIPPVRTGSFASIDRVAHHTFQTLGSSAGSSVDSNFTFYSNFFYTLTPQQELKVDLACNGTIEVYLLKISSQSLMETFSGNEPNVSLLEDFLHANPNVIGWQGEILEGEIDYIPTAVINATMIFSNPSSNDISIEYTGSILSLLAPTEKVRTLAISAIIIGFVLALPWLLNLRKSTKKILSGDILRN